MNPVDLFDEAIRTNFGQLRWRRADPAACAAEPAAILGWLRRIGEQQIAWVRPVHPNLPPIHLDFIESDQPNAFAFLHKGQRFIGVTTGAGIGMTQLFKRMLTDRRVLTHVPNPDGGTEHPPLARPVLESLLREFQKNGVPEPPTGDRQSFWLFLSQMSFSFMVLHELVHIRNGHVDYLASRGTPFLQELGWGSLTREEVILRQALEVDADIGAAAFAFDSMSGVALSDGSAVCPALQTYEHRLSALSMAIFSFFRGFADAPLAGEDLLASNHPPHRFRYLVFLGAIPDGVKNRPEITLDQANRAVARGSRMTEEAFQVLTGQPISHHPYTEAAIGGPDGFKHFQLIRKCWEGGLRNDLLKYAYAPPSTYSD